MLLQQQIGKESQSTIILKKSQWKESRINEQQEIENISSIHNLSSWGQSNSVSIGEHSPIFFSQIPLQAKLTIGRPNDKYEQEADRIAEQVMSMPKSKMRGISSGDDNIQRKCAKCKKDEKDEEKIQMKPLTTQITPLIQRSPKAPVERKDMVQTKDEGRVPAITSSFQNQLNASKGGGNPLPKSTNLFMSNAFSMDFSHVRIHNDSSAHEMNKNIQSRAFTNGSDIYFNQGQYLPESFEGKTLLAHELTHVVQQNSGGKNKVGSLVRKNQTPFNKSQVMVKNKIQCRGLNNSDEELQMKSLSIQSVGEKTIQRDLATPLPAVTPAVQPDLTDEQIQDALHFNRRRYNSVGTSLIQNLLGGPVTGNWTEDNIRAIAATQEQYGLKKDGKVGAKTFRFIDREVAHEALAKTDANCLVSFNIDRRRENIVPRNNGATMTRHFFMNARFPDYCDCSDFEYRQFIRGHFNHVRAGVVTDEGDWFANLPAGRLNAAWQEDGHTGIPSVNFGYRSRATSPDDLYLNDAGGQDRANGCRYRGEDTPGGNYSGWHVANPRTGDILDILVQFRGEIHRKGRVVRRKWWTALQRRFTLPA